MKKRTVFTVLLAMVFALSFAWTAIAAEDDACLDCGKCPLGEIECCTFSGQAKPSATYFDYESRHGYCAETMYDDQCKVVFDLCLCDDPNTNFQSGKEIGIHMTILTTGVYFTAEPVVISAWTSLTNACCPDEGLMKQLSDTDSELQYPGCGYYFKHTFGQPDVTYYDRAGQKIASPVMPTNPNWTFDCEVPCDKLAVELITCKDGGWYLPYDLVDGEFKYWFVDIPAMLLNWAEIQGREGEVVRVEVCLQGASGGICRDCEDICCCIIDVGTLCCQEGDQTCIFFPYVVTQIYPWWTGVAITNYGGNASLDLTLTLVDQNGNAFVWQKNNHTPTVWTFILDQVLGDFVGTGTPAAGPAMLKVQSNEGFIDGYSFMTDGSFGGSTLARGCCPICILDAETVKNIKDFMME